MARFLTAIFFALCSFFMAAGCGAPSDDDDDSSSDGCKVTDEVAGSWWQVSLEACGTSATVFVETDSVDGSAPESATAATFKQACHGASTQEWDSILLTDQGNPALVIISTQLGDAVSVQAWDNLTPFYDGAWESFYDACPTPAPRPQSPP